MISLAEDLKGIKTIDVTGEFVFFLTVYTLIMIAVGQFGGFMTKHRIVGSSLSQLLTYMIALSLLLIANALTGSGS